MPSISASVTNSQIAASVGETQIDVDVRGGEPQIGVAVSGGVGPTGTAGAAATVVVGTVATGAPGSSASVVNAGSSSNAVLNFTIPAGPAGPTGAQGPAGPAGSNASATTDASALVTGTLASARLPLASADARGAVLIGSGISIDANGVISASTHAHDDRYYTEAEVDSLLSAKAPLASPTFTGTVSGITAAMVGLGNVPNVDARARSSHTGTQTASTISDFAAAVASASPEEVIEATTVAGFPATGNTSALYVATDTSRFYRWTGSVYVEVGPVATYPATHTHTASQITGGTSTTFLRGDGTWASAAPELMLDVNNLINETIFGFTDNTLIYDTVDSDPYSAYDDTTGTFVVPTGKGGLYAVQMAMVAGGEMTSSQRVVGLKIDGTTLGQKVVSQAVYAPTDDNYRGNAVSLVFLTAGEEINFVAYPTDDVEPNNNEPFFNAVQLYRM